MAAKKVLVLGGTAMLGREIARQAVARGHDVTCIARGEAGDVPDGVTFVRADRDRDDALTAVADARWDAVYDVSRVPGQVRRAVRDLGSAGLYVFVSTCNVYAAHNEPRATEDAALLEPFDPDSNEPGAEVVDAGEPEHAYGRRKVACERLVLGRFGGARSLIVRSGLIGGPGDTTTRSGYWPMRFAVSDTVIIPDDPQQPTQVVDVRDLVGWMLDAMDDDSIRGVANAVGDAIPLGEFLETARRVARHRGAVVSAPGTWLLEHGVEEFAGSKSMPLWLADPEWRDFMNRSNARAKQLGLTLRSIDETLADALTWERAEGFERPRKAGMTTAEQDMLLVELDD